MKKKLLVYMLAGVMATSMALVGCGSKDNKTAPEGQTSSAAQETTDKPAQETETAPSDTEAVDGGSANAINPWVESSAEEIQDVLGIMIAEPEGAEDIMYLLNESLKLEEMRFTLDGSEYTARVQDDGATEINDISGYYYEWKNIDDKATVSGLPAEIKMATDGDTQIEVINWVDPVVGLSYSLSTTGKDLDGLDIAVIAEQVYTALQGDD